MCFLFELAAVQTEDTFANEVQLCHFNSMLANYLALILSSVSTGEHPNYCFIDKALFTWIEKVSKVSPEVLKKKFD